MRKRFILIFLLFLYILFINQISFGSEKKIKENNEIIIRKIKIKLNNEYYIWYKKNQTLPFSESYIFDLNLIKKIITLYPEMQISLFKLKKEIFISKKSLVNSTYFSKVSILIIPPKKYPDYRTIIIKLNTNTIFRYTGGKFFYGYGRINYSGYSDFIYYFVGLNKNGITFGKKYLKNSKIGFSLTFYYLNNLDLLIFSNDFSNILNNIYLDLSIYFNYYPFSFIFLNFNTDFFFTKNIDYYFNYISYNNFHQIDLSFSYGLKHCIIYNKNFSETIILKHQVLFPALTDTFSQYNKYNLILLNNFKFNKNVSLIFNIFTGYSNNNIPDYLKFNLSQNNEIMFHGILNDNLLISTEFIMTNIEFCQKIFNITLFSLFDLYIYYFLFVDYLFINNTQDNNSFLGYGPGIKLNFSAPVYANFKLYVGLNDSMQTKIIFLYVPEWF